MTGNPASALDNGLITAVLIPPATTDPIALVVLEDSTAAIAEAVGTGQVDDEQVTTGTGITIAIHLDDRAYPDNRSEDGNERAAAVLARLGIEQREILARVHGTVAITGRTQWGADTCVPPEVLTAVDRCGLETSWPRG